MFSAAKVAFSFVFIKKKQFFCVLTFDFLDSAEEIGEGILMLNLGFKKTEKSAFVCAEENGVFFRDQPYTDNAVLRALLCRVGVESGDL